MDKDPRQELCEIVGQVRGHLALQQELGVKHTDLRWPEPAAPAPMVRPTL
jgi:hypothetical protein